MNTKEQAPECCPFCHSARDPVLKSTTWACGVRLKDQTWRTKECYKRNLASATRERDEARAERDQALMLLGVYKTRSGDLLTRVKRLEEAGDAMAMSPCCCVCDGPCEHVPLVESWNAAKEAKP